MKLKPGFYLIDGPSREVRAGPFGTLDAAITARDDLDDRNIRHRTAILYVLRDNFAWGE